MQREPIPRLPVFGWDALRGPHSAGVPCMLDLPGMHFSTSGRASIRLALETLGIQAGDGVLVPTYHCPTMVAPAADLHARPVFYPIDAAGAPDLAWLAEQDLRGVRAMLAAHYFGLPQSMGLIRQWCSQRGVALIEDCAHALFGRAGERPIGAWGDMAIGSLTKFLPVPVGGCIIIPPTLPVPTLQPCSATAQIKLMLDVVEVGASQGQLPGFNTAITGGLDLLRRLRGHRDVPADPAAADQYGADFTIDVLLAHRQLGWACRWIAERLPRERIVQRRRANYERLLQRLQGRSGVRPLMPQLPPDCAPYVFPLWVDQPDPGYINLRRLSMPLFRWDRLWPTVPQLPRDHGLLWSHHVLQLACHQDLSADHLDRFVTALLRTYAPA